MFQFLPKGLSRNNHSNRSVEKPASTSNPVRRIFATGRFFINFGGAPRHGHSLTVAAQNPIPSRDRESGPGKGVWLFPDDYLSAGTVCSLRSGRLSTPEPRAITETVISNPLRANIMEPTADIALIGLAVMGQNLILNMNDHGYSVMAFNRTVSKVDEFLHDAAKGHRNVIGAHSIEEMAGLLKRPRKVMLMVKAGEAVDEIIEHPAAHLEPATSSSTAATRTSPIPSAAPSTWRARDCLHRHGGFGWRRGRALTGRP